MILGLEFKGENRPFGGWGGGWGVPWLLGVVVVGGRGVERHFLVFCFGPILGL